MASSAALDLAIEQEERLINLYNTELSILKSDQEKQKQSAQLQEHADATRRAPSVSATAVDSNRVDPLDWILQQQPQASISSLMSSVAVEEERFREDLQAMQAALRGFCFTAVDLVTSVASRRYARASTEMDTTDSVSYNFRGYFQFDTSVKADILVDFRLGRENRNGEARVLGIECKLSSETQDLTWLQEEARIKGEDVTNLSRWIQRLGDYLEFDQRRKRVISIWEEKGFAEATHVRSKSIVKIPLKSRSQVETDNDDTTTRNDRSLSIVWSWKWKEGRDVLRLTQASSTLGLKQQDLDSLVKACESCERAIGLVIPRNGDSDDVDSASESPLELCDAESVSSANEEPLKLRAKRHGRPKTAQQLDDEPILQDPLDDADDEGDPFNSERDESTNDEADDASKDSKRSADQRQLSNYELFRLERIKRNEMRLAQLGLDVMGKQQVVKRPRRRNKKKTVVSPRSRRHSSRLDKDPDEARQVGKAAEDPIAQLLEAPVVSKQSDVMKQRWADPEFRAKVASSRKRSRKDEGKTKFADLSRVPSEIEVRPRRPAQDLEAGGASRSDYRSQQSSVTLSHGLRQEFKVMLPPQRHVEKPASLPSLMVQPRNPRKLAPQSVVRHSAAIADVSKVSQPAKSFGLFQRFMENKKALNDQEQDKEGIATEAPHEETNEVAESTTSEGPSLFQRYMQEEQRKGLALPESMSATKGKNGKKAKSLGLAAVVDSTLQARKLPSDPLKRGSDPQDNTTHSRLFVKRKRGRPKGSKNKSTERQTSNLRPDGTENEMPMQQPSKKRGRSKGSKKKPIHQYLKVEPNPMNLFETQKFGMRLPDNNGNDELYGKSLELATIAPAAAPPARHLESPESQLLFSSRDSLVLASTRLKNPCVGSDHLVCPDRPNLQQQVVSSTGTVGGLLGKVQSLMAEKMLGRSDKGTNDRLNE